jgi:hypothetical protein
MPLLGTLLVGQTGANRHARSPESVSRGYWPGTKRYMPTDRSARRVLSVAMGVSAIFDLTGMTVYQRMRPVLPPTPPRQDDQDPFLSAMSTIVSAHQEAAGRARAESGET